MITETLKIEVDGTAKVNALAKALERYAKAHAAAAALPQIPFGDVPASGGRRGGGGAGDAAARREEARLKREREAAEKHVAGIKDRYFAQQQREQESASRAAIQRQERSDKNAGAAAARREIADKKAADAASRRHEANEARAMKAIERRAAAEQKSIRASRVATERAQQAAPPLLNKPFGMNGMADLKAGFDSIYGIALKVGGVVYDAGKAVLQAQAFREDVTEALAVVAGGADAAKALMDRAAGTADKLGRQRGEVSKLFLDLTTKGFNADMTDRIVRSIADLTTIDPNASAEGITKVIGKAQAQGRLNLDILSELNTFGLEQGDVIKEIGKITGQNDAEVLKALSGRGGVRGLGVEPILAAINKQVGGGEAGAAAMAKARRNLSSLMDQVASIPANVLFDLDVGAGVDTAKGKLREIIEFFDVSTESGKEVRKVVGDTFNVIAEGLFGIDTSKGGGIRDVLQSILDVVRNSKDDIRGFARGIASIGSGIAWISQTAGAISNLRAEFTKLSGVDTSGPLGIFKAILIGIPSLVAQTLSSVIQSITGFSLWDAGANLIRSLGDGITSSAQYVIDAVTSSVGGAISWAKQLLGIASPSKVFAQIGSYTSQGFAQGIAANDNAVTNAAGAMARRAVDGAAGTAFPATSAPGGISAAGQTAGASQQGAAAGNITIGPITVQVVGGRGTEAAADEGAAAARAIVDTLDALLPGALRRAMVA